MARDSALRFGAQTDEAMSLLRVINLVRTGEADTRPEIGRLTGLGRGVVAQRVEAAIEMGFLEDGEYGPSSGGRAPRTLRFRADQAMIVVCALGALHIRVGLATLDGEVIAEAHRAWDIGRGPAETIDTALGMLDELLGDPERHARCGRSRSAFPGRSTSRPVPRSRRRSCPAGTASTCAAASSSASTHRSGSTTT